MSGSQITPEEMARLHTLFLIREQAEHCIYLRGLRRRKILRSVEEEIADILEPKLRD